MLGLMYGEIVPWALTNNSEIIDESIVGLTVPEAVREVKLPFRYRWMVECRPNLAGVVPFLPLLLSSAQRIRAPV